VLDPAAHLAEPVLFEVLRIARPEEVRLLEAIKAASAREEHSTVVPRARCICGGRGGRSGG
jgi:hypothetical protein